MMFGWMLHILFVVLGIETTRILFMSFYSCWIFNLVLFKFYINEIYGFMTCENFGLAQGALTSGIMCQVICINGITIWLINYVVELDIIWLASNYYLDDHY